MVVKPLRQPAQAQQPIFLKYFINSLLLILKGSPKTNEFSICEETRKTTIGGFGEIP